MIFPLVITFRIRLAKESESQEDVDSILLYIREKFLGLRINKFTREDNKYIFKNSFDNNINRRHIFGGVNSGSFEIDKNSNEIVFKFWTLPMIIIALFMSVIMVMISNLFFFGLFVFSFTYGMSILIQSFSIWLFISKLKDEIYSDKYNSFITNYKNGK